MFMWCFGALNWNGFELDFCVLGHKAKALGFEQRPYEPWSRLIERGSSRDCAGSLLNGYVRSLDHGSHSKPKDLMLEGFCA